MNKTRLAQVFTALFVFSGTITLLSGCGGDTPKSGTQGAPVNEAEAKTQNQAINDALKSKMPASAKKK